MFIYQYNDMASFILNPQMNIDWGIVKFYNYFSNFIPIVSLNNIFIITTFLLSVFITSM